MIAALTFPQALWLLLCVQSPASLLFVGGLLGMAVLYLVSACAGLIRAYRLGVTQRDREAQAMRDMIEAAERLQVVDRA